MPALWQDESHQQQILSFRGLSLEAIAQSLAEQLPQVEPAKDIQARQRHVERILTILMGSAFTVFVLAVLWAIIYKLIILKGQIFEGLLVLGLLVAAVTALLLVIYRESLREVIAKQRTAELTTPETTQPLLQPGREPVNSVTDRTTELLYSERSSHRNT